jgi:hypothetical protein
LSGEDNHVSRRWARSGWWGAAALFLVAAVPAGAATNRFAVVNSGFSAYVINGVGNPNLKLVRGITYFFDIAAPGHPFWIKTVQGSGTANGYTNGVTGNATQTGTVTFAVPTNAPSLLFYNCEIHSPMTGQLNIEDPPAVGITRVEIESNLVIRSTGTDALNVRVSGLSDLTSGTWSSLPVATSTFSQGTNTTTLAVSSEAVMFFRVEQTLP